MLVTVKYLTCCLRQFLPREPTDDPVECAFIMPMALVEKRPFPHAVVAEMEGKPRLGKVLELYSALDHVHGECNAHRLQPDAGVVEKVIGVVGTRKHETAEADAWLALLSEDLLQIIG